MQPDRGGRRHHRRPGHRGRRPQRRDLDHGARARGGRRGRPTATCRCSPPAASSPGGRWPRRWRWAPQARGPARSGSPPTRPRPAGRQSRRCSPPSARHRPLAAPHRQAGPAAAHGLDRRVGGRRTARAPLPMPLQSSRQRAGPGGASTRRRERATGRAGARHVLGRPGRRPDDQGQAGPPGRPGDDRGLPRRRRAAPGLPRRLRRTTGASRMSATDPLDNPDPRTPVVVGVGQASERIEDAGYRRRSPVELAADAAREALADTGGRRGRRRDRRRHDRRHPAVRDLGPGARAPLGRSDNFPRSVAGRIGAAPAARSWRSPAGRARSTSSTSSPRRSRPAGARGRARRRRRGHLDRRALAKAAGRPDWTEHVDGNLEDRGYGLRACCRCTWPRTA